MSLKLSRRKKILFGFFAILFGTVAASLMIEAALRIHPPEWLKRQMESLNLASGAQAFGSDAGWSVERIDGKFVRFTPLTHFEIKYFEYHNDVNIDRWGGRVVNGNTNRMDRVVIPFLGDSFMFGVGVEDNQTFVSLLNSHSPLQYLNLGVPGSALPQDLEILDFRIKELHSPRVCVFSFYTGNDYTDIVKYYSQDGKKPANPSKPSAVIGMVDAMIHRFHFLGKSYLVEFCKQILIGAEAKDEKEGDRRKAWSIKTPGGKRLTNVAILLMDKKEPFRKEAEAYLEESLDRLVKMSKDENFLPVFIVIPDKHQIDPDLLSGKAQQYDLDLNNYDPALPDRILTEELDRRKIPYYDLFNCLHGKSEMYYKVDDHFTPAGCRRVAECLQDLNTLIANRAK